MAADKGLQLRIETSRDIARTDLSLVEQVLRILVSNAIKYTRQGSVGLRCLSESEQIRIEVADTGIGIPADQIPYIFDEFYQVGVATHSLHDGYGLGLNIVKRIVELLELRLDVKSEVGAGSIFTLSLPAGAGKGSVAEAESDRACVSALPPAARQHVLLVEDDPAVRDATRLC